MGRQKNIEQRDRIIEKAYEMFFQNGYEEVKMKDIAKSCGISPSLLQHYFAKKENLVMEIFNDLIIQIFEYLETEFPQQKDGSIQTAMFYRLFYEVLTDENNQLLKLYFVILGNANLLCRATDYAFSQPNVRHIGETLKERLSVYILNGTLSQLFTMQNEGKLLFSTKDIVNIGLESFFRFLQYGEEKTDAALSTIDELLTEDKVRTFIQNYKSNIIQSI